MTRELPEGWARTTLGGIADIALGKMLDRAKRIHGTRLPYLRNANVRWNEFNLADLSEMPFEEHEMDRYGLRAGDLMVCEGGEPGRAAVWPGADHPIKYQKALLRVRPRDGVSPEWIMYSLRKDALIGALEEYFTGTTIKHFPQQAARTYELLLPPILEQHRIVAKLEELIVKVTTGEQRLERVQLVLDQFRESVLAAACSGQLTVNWRENRSGKDLDAIIAAIEKHQRTGATTPAKKARIEQIYSAVEENDSGELPNGWQYVTLAKLSTSFDYGTAAKSSRTGRVPVLRMGNIQNGEIDWTDLVYTSNRQEIAKYSLKPQTVLFNRTNSPELVGKTGIYRGERPATFAGYLIRINPVAELDPQYLNYCLNTAYARDFCARVKTDGVSQSNINAQRLGTFEVPFCSVEEQREIVRRVKGLFSVADRMERRLAAARGQVERLIPALLAKAFRGELVPTEAELAGYEGRSYEPASIVLERIEESLKQQKPQSRSKKIAKPRHDRSSRATRRPIAEVLGQRRKRITPEQLFSLAGFDADSVDAFYAELKVLIQNGSVVESRPNKTDVYLEVARR